jgi:hypothetical protein
MGPDPRLYNESLFVELLVQSEEPREWEYSGVEEEFEISL